VFRGEVDFPDMARIAQAAAAADRDQAVFTVEDTARAFRYLTHCDPYEDMALAEVNGVVVGYGRCWWEAEYSGLHRYLLYVRMQPEWWGCGIRRALLWWLEARLRAISSTHPADALKVLDIDCLGSEVTWRAVLEEEGCACPLELRDGSSSA
jgi:mycothiol synthase